MTCGLWSARVFFRQEYWNGLPFPPPGDLPDAGIKPRSPVSPVLQADYLPLSHQGNPIYYNNITYFINGASLVAQMVKESICNARDLGLVLQSGRSSGEGNGNHPSILAWRVSWTEEL